MSIKLSTSTALKTKYNSEDLKPHDSVAAAIYEGTGDERKYLILNHVKHQMYTFPIGKVKDDQTIEEGLLAEVEEETGCKITAYRAATNFFKTYKFGDKNVKVHTHVYEVTKYTGTPANKEPHKHTWMKWMTREEIESSKHKVADAIVAYFEYLDAKKKAK